MKGNLLLGTAKGKLGDIVAKVTHGEQILSKYQPSVHNPRTPLQVEQRDIFARAASELKVLRSYFDDVGLISIYNRKHGASKNIRNTFMPLSIKSQRNQILKSKEYVTSEEPTDILSKIGNDLRFMPVIQSSQPDVKQSLIYPVNENGVDPVTWSGGGDADIVFGSDIPLGSSVYLFYAQTRDIACGSECFTSAVLVNRIKYGIEPIQIDTCPDLEDDFVYKKQGFHFFEEGSTDFPGLGGFAHYYKLTSGEGDSVVLNRVVDNIIGFDTIPYSSGFYIAYDSRGTLLTGNSFFKKMVI